MMKNNRQISVAAVAALLLSLTACGSDGSSTPTKEIGGGGSTSTDSDGFMSGAELERCRSGRLECNGDDSDGCETEEASAPVPPAVSTLRPLRGEYTGSLHAPSAENTLRPLFTWSPSESTCGELSYQIQLDDSCTQGELSQCEFTSPEIDALVSVSQFQPDSPLDVSEEAPVGRLYTWRVRACDAAERCSDWSTPAPVHVGRTLQDINGDGYADVASESNLGVELYFGGENFNGVADSRIDCPSCYNPRFAGDINGDGFADLAASLSGFETCSNFGSVIGVFYGSADPASATAEIICRTGGSPSVVLNVREVGDLTGDGFDDLGITWDFGNTENSLMVFAGGVSTPSQPITEVDAAERSYVLSSTQQIFDGRGDYNGDGYMDVVGGGLTDAVTPAELYVLHGGRELSARFDQTIPLPNCGTVRWVSSTADTNRDGLDDWAVICSGVDIEPHFGLLLGGTDDNGELVELWVTTHDLFTVSPQLDFDGDGAPEFLIGVRAASPIIWQPGVSDPESPEEYTRFYQGERMDIADHDGNGRADLVLGDRTDNLGRSGASTSFNVVPTPLLPALDVDAIEGLVF